MKYLFVIDTDQYSGNFERPMCAYVTGQTGDCSVGNEEASLYHKKYKTDIIGPIVRQESDEGCYRPVKIWPTPGWFNHGLGGHFKEGQEELAFKDYKKCAKADFDNNLYARYLKDWRSNPSSVESYQKSGWTEEKLVEAVERDRKAYKRNIKKLRKYPAYMSVAICLSKKPDQKQIELMKERAYEYADIPVKWRTEKINISGFRLIEERTSLVEEYV